MPEPIISISGLRGIIGSEVTPAVAARFAAAFCCVAPSGPIVLARDGRTSGKMLCDAIAATVLGHGRDCLDLDVASTPTAGLFVREKRAAGGIQVSASHNPPAYNGMKLFGADGRVLNSAPGERVRQAYQSNAVAWTEINQIGKRIPCQDGHSLHLQRVLSTVDSEAINRCKFRVLLDSNHGSGAILGSQLLKRLGCDVVVLGSEPDGGFEHPPEPISENLQSICEQVRGRFDIGFCQDPDADRLAIIDAGGNYIGEEFTAVLCMLRRLMDHPGPIVTNCASSNWTRWLASRFGVPFHQSAVGEANVADSMISCHAVYGGEGSGGPIDPRVGFIRDSFVGMAQILDLMSITGKTLAQIVDEFPPLSMIKDKMTLTKEKLLGSIDRLKTGLEANSISTLDGVRLDWDDRWLLLRASNTEPIVRLIAEAPSRAEAEELIQKAKATISMVAS